jgi:hypothetical protein
LRVEQVHIGFPQTVNGAHVFPVSFKPVRKHFLSVIQHSGQHVFTEIVAGSRVFFILLQIIRVFRDENLKGREAIEIKFNKHFILLHLISVLKDENAKCKTTNEKDSTDFFILFYLRNSNKDEIALGSNAKCLLEEEIC